jgi:hypothetical protein
MAISANIVGREPARHGPRVLKIVFLDFDGVLVTPASSFRRSRTGTVADPDAVQALNYLIAETGARLVITSTWRLEYSLSELLELLRSWRVQADILGVSPSGASRGDEIQEWLDKFSGPAPVDAFVILDDLTEMGKLSSRLISTEFETGLTMDHARQALEFLKTTQI